MRSAFLVLALATAGLIVAGCSKGTSDSTPARQGSRADVGEKAAVDTGYAESEVVTAVPCEPPPAAEEMADFAMPRSEPAATAEGPSDFAGTPVTRPAPDREATTRKPEIQSGLLTAGSFDDHARFDDYHDFLSEAMQNDTRELLPRLSLGRRVMIQVADAQGRPVGDARVVVRDVNSQNTLLEAATGSDGRAMFLTGHDAHGGDEFSVSIEPPDGSAAITGQMHVDQSPWKFELPESKGRLPRQLDLALVIDTTGSMGDELEYLKVEIDSIAAAVQRMFPDVDQRYALIVYRDVGDEYVSRTYDFTGSLSEFRDTLAAQHADGGGDYPESMHLAVEHAGRLDWRKQDTARVLFLVADAPPHNQFAGRTLEAVEVLRDRGVRIFPVAASGVKMTAEFVMRAASFLTIGQYLFLTDHSGVGNPHAAPHVPDYEVEHLNRLMIRMIASELAGKRLAPREVIAIEGGASPDDLPIEPEQQLQRAAQTRVSLGTATFRWPPAWVLLVGGMLIFGLLEAIVERRRAS